MRRTLWLTAILVFALVPLRVRGAENPRNTPDTAETKVVLDSIISILEDWDSEDFARFLPDTGIIQLGMNGGFLAFYMDKPGLIQMMEGGMGVLANPQNVTDLKNKLHTRKLNWFVQSPYVACEVSGDRDWSLAFFKDQGRYYLIKVQDPNCGFSDRLFEELLSKEKKSRDST